MFLWSRHALAHAQKRDCICVFTSTITQGVTGQTNNTTSCKLLFQLLCIETVIETTSHPIHRDETQQCLLLIPVDTKSCEVFCEQSPCNKFSDYTHLVKILTQQIDKRSNKKPTNVGRFQQVFRRFAHRVCLHSNKLKSTTAEVCSTPCPTSMLHRKMLVRLLVRLQLR